jgi:NAD(P)-dependent dehydrogenase (short-subunit alcohol dehydrogenase family)
VARLDGRVAIVTGGAQGICVNAVAPGLTLSETVVASQPDFLAAIREPHNASKAIQRDQYPEDLVGTLVFLASPDSDFITGQTIVVDGGSLNT